MKNNITKNHIFTALAILCGVGAVWLNFSGDIGMTILILPLLCGVFAWLGSRWYGLIIVSVTAVVTVATDNADRFGTTDVPARTEWLSDVMLVLLVELLGALLALLWQFCLTKPAPEQKRRSAVLRFLAGMAACYLTLVLFYALFKAADDPSAHWQMKNAANACISPKYPDIGL